MTSKWPVTCCEVILRSFGELKLKADKRNRVSVPKYLWKDIWHARKGDLAKKFCCDVSIGHLRSFGGHLVTRNSNMIGTIDSALKKPMKRHISCPKVRLGKKVIITGHYWSLEVIWRSFGGHFVTRNSNLTGTIDSVLKKTYEKTYNMPQSEIW